jgi:hypothetical protein
MQEICRIITTYLKHLSLNVLSNFFLICVYTSKLHGHIQILRFAYELLLIVYIGELQRIWTSFPLKCQHLPTALHLVCSAVAACTASLPGDKGLSTSQLKMEWSNPKIQNQVGLTNSANMPTWDHQPRELPVEFAPAHLITTDVRDYMLKHHG